MYGNVLYFGERLQVGQQQLQLSGDAFPKPYFSRKLITPLALGCLGS